MISLEIPICAGIPVSGKIQSGLIQELQYLAPVVE
jgi:hypothetical protein